MLEYKALYRLELQLFLAKLCGDLALTVVCDRPDDAGNCVGAENHGVHQDARLRRFPMLQRRGNEQAHGVNVDKGVEKVARLLQAEPCPSSHGFANPAERGDAQHEEQRQQPEPGEHG